MLSADSPSPITACDAHSLDQAAYEESSSLLLSVVVLALCVVLGAGMNVGADAANLRRTTPAVTLAIGAESDSLSLSSDTDSGKYLGPVTYCVGWYAAAFATGCAMPLPDPQHWAESAGAFGPDAGTFGGPFSALSRANTLESFIALVGWTKCLP